MQASWRLSLTGSMLLSAVSLSACREDLCAVSSDGGNFDGSLGERPTLTGQIAGWSRGGGFTLTARSHPLVEEITNDAFASAPIDPSGRFSITLPDRAGIIADLTDVHRNSKDEYTGDHGSSCTLTEPPDYRIANLYLTVQPGSFAAGLSAHQIQGTYPLIPYARVSYSYLDRDLTMIGHGLRDATNGSQIRTIFRVSYKAGWNSVIFRIENNNDSQLETVNTSVPQGEFQWIEIQLTQ